MQALAARAGSMGASIAARARIVDMRFAHDADKLCNRVKGQTAVRPRSLTTMRFASSTTRRVASRRVRNHLNMP